MATGELTRDQCPLRRVKDRVAVLTTCRSMPLHLAATLALLLGCADDPPWGLNQQLPTTVTVSPSSVTLSALRDTTRFTATVLDQNGRVMEGVPVTYSSHDSSVVTVDASGLATAVGPGRAVLEMRVGVVHGSAVMTVAQVVRTVVVSPATGTVVEGDTMRLTATATDANHYTVSAAQFAWSSSDTLVAVVDSLGLATGVGLGKATITATSSDVMGRAELATEAHPDRAALVAVYQATGGPGWSNRRNWATPAPIQTWSGVRLNNRGRVAQLHLRNNRLRGSIPPEIGHLTDLESLALDPNNLSGPIPPEIGNLINLKYLALNRNNLSGPIPPEIGALTELVFLALDDNDLSGPIPPELEAFTALQVLRLDDNNLTGPIPPELGDLSALRILHLSENNLTGPVPPELGQLLQLEEMELQYNEFTGSLPPTLGELANLRILQLSRGRFYLGGSGTAGLTGPIPPELGNLANLKELRFFANRLTGPIPPELGRLGELEELSLGANRLTGPIPPELGDLANLRTLYLTGNRLTGPIPPELCRFL